MSKWFEDNDDHIVLIMPDGTEVYEDGYDPTRYCDIYYCYECPKYGDDCDGKEDNMTQKKKSTPGGALIYVRYIERVHLRRRNYKED